MIKSDEISPTSRNYHSAKSPDKQYLQIMEAIIANTLVWKSQEITLTPKSDISSAKVKKTLTLLQII